MKSLEIDAYEFGELSKTIRNRLLLDASHEYHGEDDYDESEDPEDAGQGLLAGLRNAYFRLAQKHGVSGDDYDVDCRIQDVSIYNVKLIYVDLPDRLKLLVDVEEIADVHLVEQIELTARKTRIFVNQDRDLRRRAILGELKEFLFQKFESFRKELFAEFKKVAKITHEQSKKEKEGKEQELIKALSTRVYSKTGEVLPLSFLANKDV